jgi:hydrogenase nickel incorporation protein HypB
MKIQTLHNVFGRDKAVAEEIRSLLKAGGVVAVNMISGPGAGKTTLLEASAAQLQKNLRIAVLEGDIATTKDAKRIAQLGIPVVQLLTDGGCHLDAPLVREALGKLDLSAIDLLFVENVGNLVCPANFDLGENLCVALLSVAEGDDKPAKYPLLFQKADLVLLTKTDLLPHTDFNGDHAIAHVRRLNSNAPIIHLSARTGQGIDQWTCWLEQHIRSAAPDASNR